MTSDAILRSMPTTRVLTDEDLMRLPKDGRKYELVDGELRVSPAGALHEEVCANLIAVLGNFVRQNRIGKIFGSNLCYVLPGGNKRAPDVSFVARGRFPEERLPEGFPHLAPDLAVEVLSPDDRAREVLDKVGEYLQAGVRLVWVIDPKKRRASVHRSLTDVHEIAEGGSLDGEDVLPGFRCALGEIWA